MHYFCPQIGKDYIFIEDFHMRCSSFKCYNPIPIINAGFEIDCDTTTVSNGLVFSSRQIHILTTLNIDPDNLCAKDVTKLALEFPSEFKSILQTCFSNSPLKIKIPIASLINFTNISSTKEDTTGKITMALPNNPDSAIVVRFKCDIDAFNGAAILLDPCQLM